MDNWIQYVFSDSDTPLCSKNNPAQSVSHKSCGYHCKKQDNNIGPTVKWNNTDCIMI